jgi:hypothetical protein
LLGLTKPTWLAECESNHFILLILLILSKANESQGTIWLFDRIYRMDRMKTRGLPVVKIREVCVSSSKTDFASFGLFVLPQTIRQQDPGGLRDTAWRLRRRVHRSARFPDGPRGL